MNISLFAILFIFFIKTYASEVQRKEKIENAIVKLQFVNVYMAKPKQSEIINKIIDGLKKNEINLNLFLQLESDNDISETINLIKKALLQVIQENFKFTQICEVDTGKNIHNFAWSSDSTKIAVIDHSSKTVKVWKFPEFEIINELDFDSEVFKFKDGDFYPLVNFLSWSLNNNELIFYINKHLIIWDINKKNQFKVIEFDKSAGLYISPDYTKLASIYNANIFIYDLQTGDQIAEFENNHRLIRDLVWLSNTQLAFSELFWSPLKIWDIEEKKITFEKELNTEIKNLINVRGNIFFSTGNNIKFWNKKTKQIEPVISGLYNFNYLNYSDKLRILIFVSINDKHILFINMKTKKSYKFATNINISNLKLSPNSKFLAASAQGKIIIWKTHITQG